MRRTLTFILALMMAATLAIPTFAVPITNNGSSQDIDVSGQYVDSSTKPIVYKVDIAWGAMEFTYTVSGTHDWDADRHAYVPNVSTTWTASENSISVTNHSNTDITATFGFAAENRFASVTGSFGETNTLSLPTAENKAVDAAELTGTKTLTLGGSLGSDTTTLTKVGTVTVTIS